MGLYDPHLILISHSIWSAGVHTHQLKESHLHPNENLRDTSVTEREERTHRPQRGFFVEPIVLQTVEYINLREFWIRSRFAAR